MYLIVALFLIFQIDNVYPETTDTRRPDAKQIIEKNYDVLLKKFYLIFLK